MTASCLVTRYRAHIIVAHLTVASQRGLHPACMKRISEPAGQTDDKRIGPRNLFVRLPALEPTVLKSIDSASDGKTVGPLPPHN
jgi:hypothetical protein